MIYDLLMHMLDQDGQDTRSETQKLFDGQPVKHQWDSTLAPEKLFVPLHAYVAARSLK